MSETSIDKFASSTARLELSNPIELSRECSAEAGTAVVVRALAENPHYPDLELTDGTYSRVRAGDVIAGVLGSRQALRGFVGYAPYKLAAGDRLHLLNLGGVIGRCIDGHKDLGEAISVEVLGCVAKEGEILNLRRAALPEIPLLGPSKPIVLVMGSCMNVGKTAAAAEMVRRFTRAGLRVGAAKLSGIACLKDQRKYEASGAVKTYTFLDCGVPSTVDADDVGMIARTILGHLNREAIDLIVLELGDGLLGHYRVDGVLDDRSVMDAVSAIVFCASDLVSAWGGVQLLGRRGVNVDALSGPVTDNVAGTTYLEGPMGTPAANALTHGEKLAVIVQAKLAGMASFAKP
ncbi:MAG: hypothetical protein HY716_17045 [Planctomycetes bacterium]|nr:hypothetical protein [Planctomycetota bacterium]